MSVRSLLVDGYSGATDTTPRERRPLLEWGVAIRSGEWAQPVGAYQQALAARGKDAARPLKEALPAITVGARCEPTRKLANIVERLPYVQVDLDGLEPDRAAELRSRSAELPYVRLAWVSVSGHGVKLIVELEQPPTTDDDYKRVATWAAMRAARQLDVAEPPEVDPKVAQSANLCFVGYDPDAVVAELVQPLPLPPRPKPKARPRHRAPKSARGGQPSDRWTRDDKLDIASRIYDASDYGDWVKVGMMIRADGGTWTEWCQWSQQAHNHEPCQCERKWSSFGESGVTFGSLVHDAQALGQLPRRRPPAPTPPPPVEAEPAVGDPPAAPEQAPHDPPAEPEYDALYVVGDPVVVRHRAGAGVVAEIHIHPEQFGVDMVTVDMADGGRLRCPDHWLQIACAACAHLWHPLADCYSCDCSAPLSQNIAIASTGAP